MAARCEAHTMQVDPAAALLRAGASAALSHESAATAWGIELLTDGPQRLTVPRNSSRLTVPGWHVVRGDLSGGAVEERDGVRVTSSMRTVSDLCRVLPFAAAVVAADSALRLGLVELQELHEALASIDGRGAGRLRAVAQMVDPLAGSVLETLLRIVLAILSPPPITQYAVYDRHGQLVARVDFCFLAARLVVEADGYAFHSDRIAFRRDRDRLNDLERLGWRVLRFTWEDVVQRPDHVLRLVNECLRAGAA
jgi:hypothetical protein